MQPRLSALGYVEVKTREAGILGEAGSSFRGHQFRYSQFSSAQSPQQYLVSVRRSAQVFEEGYGAGALLASYVHAHWASNPAIAANFVHACAS